MTGHFRIGNEVHEQHPVVGTVRRLFGQFIAEGQTDPEFLALFRERFLYTRRDAARVMWRRGVDRGEICEEIDSEIILDLIYGPMVFRLLAGHGSLSGEESSIMVKAIFHGIRRSEREFLEDPSRPSIVETEDGEHLESL